ncbi:hypothetical protein [Bathymodiolus heckerae thiotrophic gill symbiont]|uniref:hypothetical protein n=1 Tax=Bathymodiolus heckerae thiotrophic gill symbiont TaxID=1052212 RepID=UPI001BB22F25|nr:hypothetical protein [Bathymodiolus heckerae thiotrophic gill symbiont]
MQSGSRNPGNHTNYMVTGHPNNGLQDLGGIKKQLKKILLELNVAYIFAIGLVWVLKEILSCFLNGVKYQ